MNKEAILKVADAIEHVVKFDESELGFNMGTFFCKRNDDAPDLTGHGCKTVACIAGWACVVLGKQPLDKVRSVESTAYELLGLDTFAERCEIGDPLFYGRGSGYYCGIPLPDIKPEAAIACLRHLAATGVVDWPKALRAVGQTASETTEA